MEEKDKYLDGVIEEVRQFGLRWSDLYRNGGDESIVAQANMDTNHPPAMLGRVLYDIVGEIMRAVEETTNTIPEGSERDRQTTELFIGYLKMTAVRFFRMGQVTANVLPWDNLTPCPCQHLFDDEIEDFLKTAHALGLEKLPPRPKKTDEEEPKRNYRFKDKRHPREE
jgi:hypothetical protein